MSENELLENLSKQYLIPKARLSEYISLGKEVVGLMDPKGNVVMIGEELYCQPREISKMPGLHFPIYGGEIVRVKIGKSIKEYKIPDFLKLFQSLILFVMPLYGAFEYSGQIKEVQDSLRQFSIDFGNRVREEVMVFDFWTEERFDFTQYQNQQKSIMDRFDIKDNDLPAVLVSNRSPFNWDPSDKKGKCIVLSFKIFGSSELGSRLREIASKLNKLELPSKWGHDWSRFKSWCKSTGIIWKLFEAALG
ncbi:MAG: hypothetical protein ABIL06_24175 [Pseudomonadota bacterium]